MAARVAATLAGETDLDALRAINRELGAAIRRRDAKAARAADERFHDRIVAVAGNPLLARALGPLRSLARHHELARFANAAPARASHAKHERIIAALAAGDAAEAERLTRENMTP